MGRTRALIGGVEAVEKGEGYCRMLIPTRTSESKENWEKGLIILH